LLRKAEEEFRAALDLRPDDEQALVGMADVCFSTKRIKEAKELLNRAVRLYPQSPVPRRALEFIESRERAATDEQ
jgi:tetratricopeptide (TPR) repeat protein